VAFVQFTKVSLAYGDRDLLREVGLNLATGSRAALAGANGSGKSTLMKVIAGVIKPDSGDRAVQKDTKVSYLPQSGIVHRGRTLRDEVETAFSAAASLVELSESLAKELEGATEDDERTLGLLEEHHRAHEALEQSGWYDRDTRIRLVLSGLGFSESDLDRDTEEFSGGWQMRIALSKVLLEAPDILLLDEPTNYLDIEARDWLEKWLKDFKGGYLLVSHDRYFLDVTVNEVYELFQGDLKRYAGNYSSYERVRKVELETLLAKFEIQQEEIAKTEDFIRRFRYKATKAVMVQERVKKLEKLERIEIPENLKKIHFSFPPPPHSGRIALRLEGIGKRYGERRILSALDLLVESGEKLVVVGRNGAGKTTLLRILAGVDLSYEGTMTLGTGISVGYFSQDAAEAMTGSASIIETLEAESPMELIPKLRDMAGAFLFRGDDVYKTVSVLSGGEKSRLALLSLLLHPVNLLILDEPTNHLDLHSKDVLLDALSSYPGTVIFVSHDRAFIQALATKVLELSPSGPRLFYGDYEYYLDRIERERAGVTEVSASIGADARAKAQASIDKAGPEAASKPDSGTASSAAEYREAEKKRQGAIRRLEREESDVLNRIETLEAEQGELESRLSDPAVYADGEKCKAVQDRLAVLATDLEAATESWERVAAELETLRA